MNYFNVDSDNNQSCFTDVSNVRVELHKSLYYSMENVFRLSRYITEQIASLNVDIDMSKMQIEIKIKKTVMKKIPGFDHNVIFYYPRLNFAFMQFFNEFKDTIIDSINTVYEGKCIAQEVFDKITNEMTISMMYNVTCIGDNVIIIRL